MTTATAPGKVILFGEHAVVYGQPAIAVPVRQVQAQAVVTARDGQGLLIEAVDLNTSVSLQQAAEDALARTAQIALEWLKQPEPNAVIRVTSSIPIASGLGSGAAVSAALARALSNYLGQPFGDSALSDLVYEIEKLHHGTPSGIDNTVICYNQPVVFVRGSQPKLLRPAVPFEIIIADSGVPSPTRETVGDVRTAWQFDPLRYDRLFAQVGDITREAQRAIETGQREALGPLMDHNHKLLEEMGVSSERLEALIETVRGAGAAGAKLSGGGRGGNIVALVEPGTAHDVQQALTEVGAASTIHTIVTGD